MNTEQLENMIRQYLEDKINNINNTFSRNYIVYPAPNDSSRKPIIYTANTILRVYYELLFNLDSTFRYKAKKLMLDEILNRVNNNKDADIEHSLYRYLVASVYPYIITDVSTVAI